MFWPQTRGPFNKVFSSYNGIPVISGFYRQSQYSVDHFETKSELLAQKWTKLSLFKDFKTIFVEICRTSSNHEV